MNNLNIITTVALVLSNVSSQSSLKCRACRASRARRVECIEQCCSTSSTQAKCMGSTRQKCRVVSCGDETNQVEFGLKRENVDTPCRCHMNPSNQPNIELSNAVHGSLSCSLCFSMQHHAARLLCALRCHLNSVPCLLIWAYFITLFNWGARFTTNLTICICLS